MRLLTGLLVVLAGCAPSIDDIEPEDDFTLASYDVESGETTVGVALPPPTKPHPEQIDLEALHGGERKWIRQALDINARYFPDWAQLAGQLGPMGCSGMVVGADPTRNEHGDWYIYVLTAAHCVFDKDGNRNRVGRFMAGRNTSPGNPLPYGTATPDWYWWYSYFPKNKCSRVKNWQKSLTCQATDIALIRMRTSSSLLAWKGSKGAKQVTYGARRGAHFEATGHTHIGYPACRLSSSPPGCVDNVPYYAEGCRVGKGLSMKDGWHRLLEHKCESSPGHSGGPAFDTGKGGARVWGVHVGGEFDDPKQSRVRRITPGWEAVMDRVIP